MSDIQNSEAIPIGSHKYKIGRLSIFDQMVVSRRLMPALKGVVDRDIILQVIAAKGEGPGNTAETLKTMFAQGDMVGLIHKLADAIYSLTDEDAERIVRTSLKAVTRQNPGGVFTPVLTPQGHFMFDDLKLGDALQLSWKVIEQHLGDFFSTAP